MATSHAYDAWADANLDPLPMDLSAAERDTALNTLKDIYNLTTENLPAITVVARVQATARATLQLFDVPISDDGLAGDPPVDDEGVVDIVPEMQEEPPY
jgi:hypothetical protein